MIELVVAVIFYILLSLILLYRVLKGPADIDRLVAFKSIYLLVIVGIVIFSAYSRRTIYLDVALVLVFSRFIVTLVISKYMEDKQ